MYKKYFLSLIFCGSVFASENFIQGQGRDLSNLSLEELAKLEQTLQAEHSRSDDNIMALRVELFRLSMAYLTLSDRRFAAEVISKFAENELGSARNKEEYLRLKELSREAAIAAGIQAIIDRHS